MQRAHDEAILDFERTLCAYFEAVAEEPVPDRLLLTLNVLASLGQHRPGCDSLAVFIPRQHGLPRAGG